MNRFIKFLVFLKGVIFSQRWSLASTFTGCLLICPKGKVCATSGKRAENAIDKVT
jgi:hypothetical protein